MPIKTKTSSGITYSADIPEGTSEDEEHRLMNEAFHVQWKANQLEKAAFIQQKAAEQEINDPSVLENIAEIPKTVVQGGINAVGNTVETVEGWLNKGLDAVGFPDKRTEEQKNQSAIDSLDTKVNDITNLGYLRRDNQGNMGWTSELLTEENPELDVTILGKPNTGVGHFSEAMSRFIFSMYGVGKFRKALGLKPKTPPKSKIKKYGDMVLDGMLGEQLVFDPFEDRLSNLVQEYPALQNPLTDYLEAEEGDTEAEARFKMAGEAIMIEGVLLPIFAVGRAYKAYSKGLRIDPNDKDALVKWADSLAPDVDNSIKELDVKMDTAARTELELQDTIKKIDKAPLTASTVKRLKAKARKDAVAKVDKDIRADAEKRYGYGSKVPNRSMVNTADDIIVNTFVENPTIRTTLEAINNSMKATDFDKWAAATGRLVQYTSRNFKDAIQLKDAHSTQHLAEIENIKFDNTLTATQKENALGEVHTVAARNKKIYDKARQELVESVMAYRGAGTIAGRAVQLQKLFQKFDANPQDVEKAFDHHLRSAPSAKVMNSYVHQVVYFTEEYGKLTLKALDEIFINNILYGFKTHFVNSLMNVAKSHWSIAERLTASGIRRLGTSKTSANGIQARRDFMAAQAQLTGYYRGMGESFKMAMDGYKQGRTFLDANRTVDLDRRNVIGRDFVFGSEFKSKTLKNLGIKFEENPEMPFGQWIAAVIGTTMRAGSTRALGLEDEFFKNLNFRSRVYGEAFADGWTTGGQKGLTGNARRQFAVVFADKNVDLAINEQVKNNINNFKGVDAETNYGVDALQYSRENTFTQNLETGSKAFQDAVAKIPLARQVFPFIRTPLNLLSDAAQRSPFAPVISGRWRADYMAKGERRALALTRMAQGYAIIGAMTMRYYDDEDNFNISWDSVPFSNKIGSEGTLSANLTGTGSRNFNAASLEREMGNYLNGSIVANGTQFQIARLDPASTIVEMIGMIAELQKRGMTEQADNVAMLQLIAMANLVGNETYMKSVKQLLNAAEDTSGSGLKKFLIQRSGQVFVPASGLIRGTVSSADPFARELRNALDGIKANLPWLSRNVAPKYDHFGNPVERVKQAALGFLPPWAADMVIPISKAKITTDPVVVELINQGITVPKLNPIHGGGAIDLNKPFFSKTALGENMYDIEIGNKNTSMKIKDATAFDRLNEIMRSLDVGQQLLRMINSPDYKKATNNIVITAKEGKKTKILYAGSRKDILQNIITKQKMRALDQLIGENPRVAEAFNEYKMNTVRAKAPLEQRTLVRTGQAVETLNEVLGAN